MKIIVIKERNDFYKDDTDVYCEGFERAGHTIKKIEIKVIKGKIKNITPMNTEELKSYDVIWSPYGRGIIMANYLKSIIKKPVVGHCEWIPPWRVGADDITKWGYTENDRKDFDKSTIDAFKAYYRQVLDSFLKCDVKTTITDYTLKTIIKLLFDDIEEKPYIIDDKLLLSKVDKNIKTENQILTIGRLEPHKRIHHIIEALSKIDNAPLLKIIGYGTRYENLLKLANKLNVKIKFMGKGQDGYKAEEMQKSLFLVTPVASLPVGEAALFKKATILYDVDNSIQKHGNLGHYVKTDDIEALSKTIKNWIEHPEIPKQIGQIAYQTLMDGKTGIRTTKDSVNRMVNIFKKVVK